MKRLAGLAVVLLGGTVAASAQTVLTTATYNGHAYSLITGSTWTIAETAAVSMGGHLATIEDATEDAWVFSTFRSYPGVNNVYWIGLNDAATEGRFVWSSGSTSTYRHWGPGQPDDANNSPTGEDYVDVFGSGEWNDAADAAGAHYGIVEVEAVPEPASLAALGLGALALLRRRK